MPSNRVQFSAAKSEMRDGNLVFDAVHASPTKRNRQERSSLHSQFIHAPGGGGPPPPNARKMSSSCHASGPDIVAIDCVIEERSSSHAGFRNSRHRDASKSEVTLLRFESQRIDQRTTHQESENDRANQRECDERRVEPSTMSRSHNRKVFTSPSF